MRVVSHRVVGACAAPAVLSVAAGAFGGYPPLVTGVPLATGAQTSGAVPAPPGTLWSEVPPAQGIVQGHLADASAGASVADDFFVPDPEGWALTEAVVYAYQPGAGPQDQAFTGASARLWSGRPGDPNATVIWASGEDCLASVAFSGVYRTDSRGLTTRPVFELHLAIAARVPPGTCWLEWSATGTRGAGVWAPAMAGSSPWGGGANGVQSLAGRWELLGDAPIGGGAAVGQGLPMTIRGTVRGSSATCYPNCDGSGAAPVLSVLDFTCFLRRYALGSPYANCDGSEAAPVLNVADFTCYLQQFANGCSAP